LISALRPQRNGRADILQTTINFLQHEARRFILAFARRSAGQIFPPQGLPL
jgi:hypothetical protein